MNDRNLRSPDGWSRRQPTVRDNREARLVAIFPYRIAHETVKAETGSRVADCEVRGSIAVGTSIAERPPLRSVRAGFPHTAPTSGV